jgi:hypothetical protein
MKDIKNYFWLIPFIGGIICLIAFLTPTAIFENIIWNHSIHNWIWGYFYETLGLTSVSRFYNDPLQLISSVIASTIIITCIMIILALNIKNRNSLKKGIISSASSLVPAILIIITTATWMIMMEIAELQLYDLSMWGRYLPNFGLIGMFLGAGLIISGFLLLKKSFSTR